ncbi:MAG: hypothetical protein EPN84_03340 [Legionella sp.]|nr:MAG: hypothetical protein EPN84_03340 [Legionella sp.]
MKRKNKLPLQLNCSCSKIPFIAHELTQSLLVINAFATGSIERLKESSLTLEQLNMALEKVIEEVNVMSNKINSLSSSI